MASFGLNGYLCEVTPIEGGYRYSASDAKYPDLVKYRDVKGEDLIPGLSAYDRAQAEEQYAPVFAELDQAREDRVAEEAKKNAEATQAARAEARKRVSEKSENTAPSNVTPVADDGTYQNMNVHQVSEGDPKDPNGEKLQTKEVAQPDGSKAKIATGKPTSKGKDQYTNANASARADAKQTGEQIIKNDTQKGDSSAT